jgi:hypothetical protein
MMMCDTSLQEDLKENMDAMKYFLSMKVIYRMEQEISSKETITNVKERNANYSLNAKGS